LKQINANPERALENEDKDGLATLAKENEIILGDIFDLTLRQVEMSYELDL